MEQPAQNQGSTLQKKVDESWKNTVEKERLAGEASPAQKADAPPPNQNFMFLVSSLAMQALVALGESPELGGDSGYPADLPQAKQFIDILQALREKTKGNLAPDEDTGLENVLHELRTKFLQKSKKP